MLKEKELKNLKLIVFDLDGTLLNNEGHIGIETKKLVCNLKELGVQFTFATKRPQYSIVEYAEELGIRTPLISLDGALVQSHPEKITIYESFVPERYVNKSLELAKKFSLKICLCLSDTIYYTKENASIMNWLDKFGAVFKEISSFNNLVSKSLEVVIAGEQPQILGYVYSRLQFPKSFGLDTSFYRSDFYPDAYYLEIRKGGSSKGRGMKRLAKYLNIKLKETAVVGDWYNDVSLFDTRALKIAVANAVYEIKQLSDFVTERTNNEDGIAEFLEMVIRNKKG
jgi:Cof subfamily protein (haloacid dehalogenase superfamily)